MSGGGPPRPGSWLRPLDPWRGGRWPGWSFSEWSWAEKACVVSPGPSSGSRAGLEEVSQPLIYSHSPVEVPQELMPTRVPTDNSRHRRLGQTGCISSKPVRLAGDRSYPAGAGWTSGGLFAWCTTGDVTRHQCRVDVLQHCFPRDDDALDVLAARHLVHH